MRRAARSATKKALLSRRQSEEAYGIAISVLQKKRQWQKALGVFEDFKSTGGVPSTAKLWNAALGAACAGAAWRLALQFFTAATTTTADVSTYTAAMTAMVRAQKWKEGLEIFESMDLVADMPALLLGIRLYSELGHHEAAWGLKTGQSQIQHVEIYNALLSASSRRKDVVTNTNAPEASAVVEMVQDLLLEMWQVRLTLTRVSYGAALQAFGKYGAWIEALKLIEEMASWKVLPDVQAFTSGINACGRAGRWLHAMQLVEAAYQRGLGDHQLQNALLSALGRASLWQMALLELENLSYRSTVSWNAGITACAEAVEWTTTLALLSRATADARADRVSYNATLAALRNASSWMQALELLSSMCNASFQPDDSSFSTLVASLQRSGEPKLALQLFEGFEGPGPAAYTAALKAAADAQLWQLALTLMEDVDQRGMTLSRLGRKALLRALATAPPLALARARLSEEEMTSVAGHMEKQMERQGGALLCGRTWTSPAAHQATHPKPLELLPKLAREPVNWEPLEHLLLNLNAELWPLGSRAEGSAIEDSDADATIIFRDTAAVRGRDRGNFEEQRELQRQTLRKLRGALVLEGIDILDLVLEAKRPILRIALPCGLLADISVENRLGARKSALLAWHVLHGHPALGAAMATIKSWAKRRGVYGQSHGFPSGLGFSCLAVFAAQRLEPPAAASSCDWQEIGDVAPVQQVYAQLGGRQNEQLLSELPQLLRGIYGFYAEDFDWTGDLVSITPENGTTGRTPTRAGGQLRIQDPVQSELDLAQPYMDKARSEQLHQEIQEAFQHLRHHRWADFLGTENGVASCRGPRRAVVSSY